MEENRFVYINKDFKFHLNDIEYLCCVLKSGALWVNNPTNMSNNIWSDSRDIVEQQYRKIKVAERYDINYIRDIFYVYINKIHENYEKLSKPNIEHTTEIHYDLNHERLHKLDEIFENDHINEKYEFKSSISEVEKPKTLLNKILNKILR